MQEINRKNIRLWSMLGQRGAICGIALPEIMKEQENCFVLTADLGHTSGLDRVMETYPDRFVNVGIAEQNLIGVAAGIAEDQNVAVATTFATFLTMRSFEQIRHNLGYQKANVKLLGAMGGFAIGMFGNTHYAYEDIALMRTIPDMVVISPADASEAYKSIYAAVSYDGPVYLRMTDGINSDIIYKENYDFQIGRAVPLLEKGDDVVIISAGAIISDVLKAAEKLAGDGVKVSVINMHTIKPLDENVLKKHITAGQIVTVEEHSVIGGLGSAVCEFYAGFKNAPAVTRIGVEDKFVHPGTQKYIKHEIAIDDVGIYQKIKELISSGRD